jgi:aminoglycoside phosphotransferase (APT) family kinase protein
MPRHALSPAALSRVRDAVAPGARVVRVRPLHGGLSSSVHLVHLAGHAAVIVRRYGAYTQAAEPEACQREFRILGVLTQMGQPVPAPLLLDAEGGPFGAPTIVMSRLPGRPLLVPHNLADYLTQMARALVRLHTLPVDDFAFLPDQRVYVERALQPDRRPSEADPLQASVWAAAHDRWSKVARNNERRAVLHGDYWPGNLLWSRQRLVGIVDWEQPRLGDPTKDVATCRGDLSILFGLEAADAFLQAYLTAGGSVDNLDFWDLLIATWAVREIGGWATVYPRLGRPDLTPALAERRIRQFATRALESLTAHQPGGTIPVMPDKGPGSKGGGKKPKGGGAKKK